MLMVLSTDVGPSVDLVGTGTTESADFRLCGFIDKLYSFFWREVDLTYGALEMFEHPDFTGNRMKLFLSEWSPEMNHDLSGWHLATSVSSLKGTSLLERQSVTLTRSPGDKDGFNQVMGWSGNKEITNMANTGYDNSISCWSWPPLNPIKETITPIKFSGSGSEVKDVSLTQSYENHTDTEQTQEFTFKQTITDTFTVSTNVMHVVAITVKATVGVEATVPLVGTAKNEYSLEVAYNYTNSKTETTTHTDTMEIGERYMTICAPQGLTEVKLFASVGKLPEAVYTTKAKRWYTQELDGTVKDAVGYWREEDTQVTISGGVLIKSDVKVYFNAFGKGGGK